MGTVVSAVVAVVLAAVTGVGVVQLAANSDEDAANKAPSTKNLTVYGHN